MLGKLGLGLWSGEDTAQELTELLGPGGGVELQVDDDLVRVVVATDHAVGAHSTAAALLVELVEDGLPVVVVVHGVLNVKGCHAATLTGRRDQHHPRF